LPQNTGSIPGMFVKYIQSSVFCFVLFYFWSHEVLLPTGGLVIVMVCCSSSCSLVMMMIRWRRERPPALSSYEQPGIT
jgi:uncharacterized membrane protein